MSEYSYVFPDRQFFITNLIRSLEKNISNLDSADFDLARNMEISFEDVGLAYYYDHKNHGWNKNGLVVNFVGDKAIIEKLEEFPFQVDSAIESLIQGNSGYDLVKVNFSVFPEQSFQSINSDLQNKIKMISVRNAAFDNMSDDEKLGLLNMLIENLLKKEGKFISVPYEEVFYGYLNKEQIKEFRKRTHPERHGTDTALAERESISDDEKKFLIDLGIFIVIHLNKYLYE